jgi:hypothetical protein
MRYDTGTEHRQRRDSMAHEALIRSVMSTMTDDTLNTSVFAMQDGEDWTGDLAGHTVRYASLNLEWTPDVVWDDQDNPRPVQVATKTVTGRSICSVAAEMLDLTPEQRDELFFTDAETVDQLWKLVTEVTGVTRGY